MSNQVHHMPWGLSGTKVTREWTEPVKSGSAEGTAYYIEFINAKGKTNSMIKRVEWHKHWEGCDYSKVNPFLQRA